MEGGDFWIVKLSDVGTIEWEKSLGGGYSEIANGITQTTDGGYILTGGIKSADGDVVGHPLAGTIYIWVVKLSASICDLISNYSYIDNGNGNYSFTNNSTGNITQTNWSFGDGTTSTQANPNHTFNANGTYAVVLNY